MSTAPSTTTSLVVDKVKKRIGELEEAIQRLDFVKKHLNQNSSEVKSQIHTSISRHLETLRNREVWLLEQVDTVLGVKEDVLHQQQARLNKALGILHSSLTLAADTGDENAACRLIQALEEINSTGLKAEETPYIAYRADHLALRESILNYGRVDANGMPLLSAFADGDVASASLPRHLEEYEDSEHHVFYKALQDIKSSKTNVRMVMPKLSSRLEDWLQQPVLGLSTSAPEPGSGEGPGSTPASQGKCAIQNWLSQIKHNPDVEEDDDFEIVDHSGSSLKESPVEEDMKPLPLSEEMEFVGMFNHITRDSGQWLVKGGGSGNTQVEEDMRTFFKHIPYDTSVWLSTARRQLESLDHLKRGGWFRHIPKETSNWLRRCQDKRTTLAQPAVPDMFAHIPLDKATWLKKKASTEEMEQDEQDRGARKTGTESPMEREVDRWAVPCSLPSPLASTPNVMQSYVSSTPSAQDFWLLHGKRATGPAAANFTGGSNASNGSASSQGATFAYAFSHISTSPSDWLLDPQGGRKASSPVHAVDLQKAAGKDQSLWLLGGSSPLVPLVEACRGAPFATTQAAPLQPRPSADLSDWLLCSRDTSPPSSDRSFSIVSSEPSFSSTLSLPQPEVALGNYIQQMCRGVHSCSDNMLD